MGLFTKPLKSFTFILGGLLAVGACNYYEPKAQATPVEGDLKPTFAWVQDNILKPRCVRCHKAGHNSGFDATTYEAIMEWSVEPGDPDNSVLCLAVRDGSMPPRGVLTEEAIEALCEWIALGAKKEEVAR